MSDQNLLFIPGPTNIPDRLRQAMDVQTRDHRAPDFVDLMLPVQAGVKEVFGTDSARILFFPASGTGGWEAAITNTLSVGDKVLMARNGVFSHRWIDLCQRHGLEVQVIDCVWGNGAPADKIEAALAADAGQQIKAVLITHNETATGVRSDIASIRDVMDSATHSALLFVDCVSSLASMPFAMDEWGVDIMVAACQKGLMVPPGIGFVFFNERARERQKQIPHVSSYWDWEPRINPKFYYEYFCGTAPTHHIYGLRTALDMIKNEEIENTWKRHEILSRAIWAAIDKWSLDGDMSLNVKDSIERSHAVTSIRLGGKNGTKLRQWLQTKSGLTIGIGLGMSEPGDPNGDGFVRFGHMGHVNAQMVMALLGAVEAGLNAIEYKHGNGGLEAASIVLSSI